MQTPNIKLVLIVFGLMFLGNFSHPLEAEEAANNINMILGDVQSVKVNGLTRVSVTDPDIADIADAKDTEVSIVARKMGHTVLFVWDAAGKRTYSVNIASDDLERLKARLVVLLKEAGITTVNAEANYAEGKIILSGNVNKDQKDRLEKVLAPMAEQVMNLCKENEGQELIQIDMQILEVSSTFEKNIGMTWSGSSGETDLKLLYKESSNTFVDGAKDWLKVGQFNRQNALINAIDLMIKEGKARTLSRPRILVTSGKEATVNVGGEIPITSTTSNALGGTTGTNTGGTFTTSVTFKQYGLTATVTPTIKEDKIDISLNLQVSDIDTSFTLPATQSGNSVAYKTRNAQTQLMLDDRQTVLLAGLIRYNDGQTQARIPVLGKVPLIGMFFRHSKTPSPEEAKELVITLTPVILHHRTYAKDQIRMPTKALKEFVDHAEKINNYKREPVDPDPSVMEQEELPKESIKNVDVERTHKKNVPIKLTPMKAVSMEKPRVMIEKKTDPLEAEESITTVQKYMQNIQVKISQNISYPYEALKNKWQGTVKLKLNILKDGTLVSAVVSQSSGKQVFDDDALNAAKIAAPYAPFSRDMQANDLNVTIPIVYQAK